MKQLTTAQRIVIGFAIAPLALVGLVFYALHDLATLKQQSEQIVQQDWPKIAPIMVIATGVRDNGRNTRDLLIDQDNPQAQAAIGTTRQRITDAFGALEPLLDTAEGKAAYATLKTHREAYVAAFTQVQALIETGRPRAGAGAAQATGDAGRTGSVQEPGCPDDPAGPGVRRAPAGGAEPV
ncbi:MCP four helix bundle domain-containing protein [Pseudomonas sp. S3_A03]